MQKCPHGVLKRHIRHAALQNGATPLLNCNSVELSGLFHADGRIVDALGDAMRAFFSSRFMFAPPPQPQSSTSAFGASRRNRSPHRATGLWPRFIMATISFPPRPTGLRVFSKNDIWPLRFRAFRIGQRERGLQHRAFLHRPAVLTQET